MNVKVAVLLVALGLQIAHCCDETEKKEPRRRMVVLLNATKITEGVSTEYVKWDRFRLSLYNASDVKVIQGSFRLLKDFPPTAYFTVIGNQFMNSNKFSEIPVPIIKGNLCEVMQKDCLFYYDLRKQSNLPGKCPFVKGDYSFPNYLLNEYYLPVEWPGEQWRLFFTITDKKDNGKILFQVLIGFTFFPTLYPNNKEPEP